MFQGNDSYNYDVIKQRTDSLFDEIPCDANVSIDFIAVNKTFIFMPPALKQLRGILVWPCLSIHLSITLLSA